MRKIWFYWFVMRLYKQPLLLVGPLCIFFGSLSLILMVVLFMKPEDKRPQLVGERIRLPITSIEKKEEPPIPGVVGNKGVEEKPLEGGMPEEEKPIVSKPPESSMVITRRGLDEKVVIIGGIKIKEDEKTQAGERRYKDKVFGQEIVVGDIKIKEKIPRTISLRKERTTSEIQEKSVKEISQSHPITPDRVKLQRERGPIEATPTKTSEPEEKPIGFSFNEEMAEGKRAEKVEEKTAQKDMVGDEKAPSPVEASSPLIKSETAMTAQKSVPQPAQLKHTEDLKKPNALSEYDAPTDLSDKSISVARLPIGSSSSIEGEERTVQPKPPSLIATEEEVRQFFADYIERYTQKDIDGFLSLFSPKAVQNQRDGFDEIKKIYSDFFDKSKHLRYHIGGMRIDIYQNAVEARGRYKVDQILKKRGKKKIWRGDIRWILVRENGALRIRYLDFRPQKSP